MSNDTMATASTIANQDHLRLSDRRSSRDSGSNEMLLPSPASTAIHAPGTPFPFTTQSLEHNHLPSTPKALIADIEYDPESLRKASESNSQNNLSFFDSNVLRSQSTSNPISQINTTTEVLSKSTTIRHGLTSETCSSPHSKPHSTNSTSTFQSAPHSSISLLSSDTLNATTIPHFDADTTANSNTRTPSSSSRSPSTQLQPDPIPNSTRQAKSSAKLRKKPFCKPLVFTASYRYPDDPEVEMEMCVQAAKGITATMHTPECRRLTNSGDWVYDDPDQPVPDCLTADPS